MVKLNKRIIISLFVLISVVLFQVQSVLAITELDTITFTAYHLGGSEDDMNYGGGSEWGRGALQLNGGIYGETKNVVPEDHMAIRFSVNQECQPFYCIELGGHLDAVNGSEYSKRGSSFFDDKDTGYLKGSRLHEMLGNIVYNGFHDEFDYTGDNMWEVDYDSNSDKISYYIATQILVWETIYGYRDSDFDYVGHDGLDEPLDFIETAPTKDQIMSDYNSIVSRVKRSLKIPSFMYTDKQEAIENAYEVPFDYEQGLFATHLHDNNSRLGDFGLTHEGGTLYYLTYGSVTDIDVSIPKNSTITYDDPIIMSTTEESSVFKISDVVVWESSNKQNGITWGLSDSVAIKGYAAFYPGPYAAPSKGSIKIYKRGEAFTGTEKVTSGEYELTIPTYSMHSLQGVEFTLKAAEDIYYDYEILYRKGEVVATKSTDEEGYVTFGDLGCGTYEICETEVTGNDYIENSESILVTVGYEKTYVTIDNISKTFDNLYQKVKVGGQKNFDAVNPNLNIDISNEMQNVLMGLYAGEDIIGLDDAIIKKDTLIAIAVPEIDGGFIFNVEVPSGDYYVKELKGSQNFIMDPSIHEVKAECNENEQTTHNTVDSIVNKTGVIKGIKTDEDGKPLKNAVIGLFSDIECTEKIDEYITDSDGYFEFKDLIIRTYYIKELSAPEGYILDDSVYEVESSLYTPELLQLSMINKKPSPTPTSTPTPSPTATPTPTIMPTATPTPMPPEEHPEITVTTTPADNPRPSEIPQRETPNTITATGEKESVTLIIGRSMICSLIITAVSVFAVHLISIRKDRKD